MTEFGGSGDPMENWPVKGAAAALLERSYRNGALAHAYVFLGPEGSGKKETAVHFAKMILCARREEAPCGECVHCRRVASGNHPDLLQIEPEGQAVKIGQIRELQRAFLLKSTESACKVYILHQADQMTAEAANALLKFLEEPATPVVALLLAENRARLLPTVLSRCQIVPFGQMPMEGIVRQLQQDGIAQETAAMLAKITGSAVLSKEWSSSERFAEVLSLVLQLTEELADHQGNPFLTLQEKVVKPGWTPQEIEMFLTCLAWWFRDLLFVKLDLTDEIAYMSHYERLQSQAARYSWEAIIHRIDVIHMTKKHLQGHANQPLALEHMVLRLQGVR
jgi:DNA polymerase-3 subunit delta'